MYVGGYGIHPINEDEFDFKGKTKVVGYYKYVNKPYCKLWGEQKKRWM